QNRGIPPGQAGVIAANEIFSALQYGPVLLDQKERVIGAGPFSELQWEMSPDWAITLGARYDHYWLKVCDRFVADGADDSGARNMDQLSPMIGLAYHPDPVLTAYMNYSTAFQIPTTTELGNRPTGEGGFNPDLNPETIRSFEAGLKGRWPQMRLNYDFALYRFDIEDMLISYQIPVAVSAEVFFRNAGKARNQGVEMKLQWLPLQGLQAAFACTFMNFRFEDFLLEASSGNAPGVAQLAGKKVPGVLPHRFFAGVIYEHGSGAYAEINWQQVGRYFTNDFNGPPPGSSKPLRDFINEAYQITDVRVGWQGRYKGIGGEIFGGSNNLFDARYNGSIVPNASGDRFFEP
ncbi:MAG: TonB-dependent receptor, partial [bacterium]